MSGGRNSEAKHSAAGAEERTTTQQESGTLWQNQDEMKRYVLKLKAELDEQKRRVKRVHRDKAEEIRRLQEHLNNEREKAVENTVRKLQNDKAFELRRLKESVSKQKEGELREIVRVKDDELRAMKQDLNEIKNTSRILEQENKRIISERLRGDSNELVFKRLKTEVVTLKEEKRRVEEELKLKSDADFEKAEIIRKMAHDHELEVQRLQREAKKEAMKEYRHLKATSKQLEEKNHQLANREAEMRRLESEKNSLGNELNLQRKKTPGGKLRKSNSLEIKKSDPEFENVAEEKIKRLKTRNTELVSIARKLEVKAKQLQEEKEILEKSSNGSTPEVGQLKKAFARQRAKDLAEHAKLLMNKDNEINNLKKEVQGSPNNLNENDELTKIIEQGAKERLSLEKQLSSQEQSFSEQIKELNEKNIKLLNDQEMLKEELQKLQDIEAEHFKIVFELDEMKEEQEMLQQSNFDKDNRISKLELEKETFVAENNALQLKNNELSSKVSRLDQLENQNAMLKQNFQNMKNEYDILVAENHKLRSQIESLSNLRKEVERLKEENKGLFGDKQDSVLKLQEREKEISALHQMQSDAQRKHDEEVSQLSDMIQRLKTQSAASTAEKEVMEPVHSSLHYVNSTPKDSKCTQTSRASSPTLSSTMSPIKDHSVVAAVNGWSTETTPNHLQDSLLPVPEADNVNGTNSSASSCDLSKTAKRIDQLAASSDSEDSTIDQSNRQRVDSPFSSSELSSDDRYEDEGLSSANDDTSYSADVSQTSDTEPVVRNQKRSPYREELDKEDDAGVFIGSPSPENLDLDEKLSIFIAKYSYDPMLYSPNENPEIELAFQAGDYLYVYDEVDEDGFFVGELMSGERGLVPSNFIERIAEEDEAILKGYDQKDGADNVDDEDDDEDDDSEEDSSDEEITLKDEDGKRKVIRPKAFSERRHEMFRTSLDHVLNDQLDDIRESEEEDLGSSSISDIDVAMDTRRNHRTEVDQNFSDGLDSMGSATMTPKHVVSSPSKLCLDRQFATSALVSWQGAQQASDEIQGYNIYVDGKLKTHIKGSNKTNALVEDINPSKTYRLSVRTKSIHGVESVENEATIVFGPDAKLSPYDLKVSSITAISAQITWVPANSCYGHEIHRDDSSIIVHLKPSISSYTFSELTPDTRYTVRVWTQISSEAQTKLGHTGDEADLTSEIEFTTSAGGLPESPVDLRVGEHTADHIILTWLPVTISQDGYSNGFKVTNYKVFVNDMYCTETDSPSAGNVTISNERLRDLGKRHDLSRMRFVVRTQSLIGESVDSNAVEILKRETESSVEDIKLVRDKNVEDHGLKAQNVEDYGSKVKNVDGSLEEKKGERKRKNSHVPHTNDIIEIESRDGPLTSSSVSSNVEEPGVSSDELTSGDKSDGYKSHGGKKSGARNGPETKTRQDTSMNSRYDLGTSVNRQDDLDASMDKQDDSSTPKDTTVNRQDYVSPSMDRQDDLGTSMDKQDDSSTPKDTTVDRQNCVSSSMDRHDDLGTSMDKQDYLSTPKDKRGDSGRTVDRQDYLSTSMDKQDVLGTSMDNHDDLSTPKDKHSDLGTTVDREDYLSTSMDRQDDLGTTVDTQHDLGRTVDRRDYLSTSMDTRSDLGATRDGRSDLGTSVDKEGDLSSRSEEEGDLRSIGDKREPTGDYPSSHELMSDYNSSTFEDDAGSIGTLEDNNSAASDGELGSNNMTPEPQVTLADSAKRTRPEVAYYAVQHDGTESESCTAESTTETEDEPVELFNNVKTNEVEVNERKKPDHLPPITDTADDSNRTSPEAAEVVIGPLSESETETDGGEVLSIIHEVDEDNLTTTGDSSTGKPAPFGAKTKNLDYVKNMSSFVDSSDETSSFIDSKTRTMSSDDEGFRTEDDVLDLLDDERSVFARDTSAKMDQTLDTVTDGKEICTKEAVAEPVNDSKDEKASHEATTSDTVSHKDDNIIESVDIITSGEVSKEASGSDEIGEKQAVTGTVNESTPEKINETASNEGTSCSSDTVSNKGDIVSENMDVVTSEEDELEQPETRTSLNSGSLSSISDTPPPQPHEAVEAIMKTLTAAREPGSGASDVNDSLQPPGNRTSEVFSDSGRSVSETSDLTSERVRYFVALYEYDPLLMSPNEDGADEELPFDEGDLIKVFGDKDEDGFYWGECRTHQGYVPSNMVTEVPIEEGERMFNDVTASSSAPPTQISKTNGHCEIDVDMLRDIFPCFPREGQADEDHGNDRMSYWDAVENGDLGPRKMRALFDYNPARDSPNVDREAELMFSQGEVIHVFGEMDDDGFFQGELRGMRGLVPSNFLAEAEKDSEEMSESGLTDPSPKTSTPKTKDESTSLSEKQAANGTKKGREEEQQKKKKGLFSKGKRIFKKAFR